MRSEPIILESAHRRGVSEEDMLHALRWPVLNLQQADDMTMVIGPATDGTLIEVGLVHWHEALVIAHAMRPARDKYAR
ncbi:hypothetical protein [Aeromicrobium alkaliterrae]|uniref:Toxin n=1 Tax=Aeromicrobium alkaliterrae TaxID=302168 RepID=A0ABN2JVY4_9ACTN